MTAPIRVKTKLSQLFSLICFVHFNAYQDSKNMTFRKKLWHFLKKTSKPNGGMQQPTSITST